MLELDPEFANENVQLVDSDTMVNLDQMAADIVAEEACATNGNCATFPAAQKLQIKVRDIQYKKGSRLTNIVVLKIKFNK